MKIRNLHELINTSDTCRQIFLSLPVQIQMDLHECSDVIRSERDLIAAAKSAAASRKKLENCSALSIPVRM
ncbi:MAG: hypothetical protein IJP24_01530 [Firmicutes bacterium]|nr:hypothetical protein [Clostridiales bacterium]MBQ9972176.1 hypothetical protein [Bacillota bacterium]